MKSELGKLRQGIQNLYWKRIASDWKRANHDLRETDLSYSARKEEADKAGDVQGSQDLSDEWRVTRDEQQDQVNRLGAMYWRKKAAKYHVPEPPHEKPYWIQGENRPPRLTVEGIDFYETRIYEKRKRRWEFWFMAITTVTGLIGALTGLVAVWHYSK
jgi:hypothetical protein